MSLSSLSLFLFSSFFLTNGFDVQSGAGYSLSFQSPGLGSDIATLWNYFDCAPYWPSTQITFSFWLRCLSADIETNGIFCGSSIFIQSYIKGGGYKHAYSPLVTMDPSGVSAILQNGGRKFPAWLDFFNWHMYTIQSDTVLDTTSLYIDGVLFSNITTVMAPFSFCDPLLSGTLINIGRNFFAGTEKYVEQAQGRGFFGEIDELSMWNRTLSPAEITKLYTTKLRGDEYGLLTYYDFNEGSGSIAKNLAFTGSDYDLHLGQGVRAHVYLDATTNSIYELTMPTFAPSKITLSVDPNDGLSYHPQIILTVPQANTLTLLNFNLTGYPDVSYIQILNAPTYGTLRQSTDGITAGSIINSFPAQLVGPYLFYSVPSSPLFDTGFDGFDQFNYLLFDVSDTALTNGTINCIPNLIPYSTNQTRTAQSGLTLLTSPATIDPRGGKLKWHIISVPEHGALFQTNADGSVAAQIAAGDYLSHNGGFFAYQPPTVGGGAGLDNFVYIAEDQDGGNSIPYAFIFNVNPFNFKPETVDQGIQLDENDRIYIDLQSVDKDGQLVATSISKLPSHGKLFIANPDDSIGAEITKVANPYDGVTVKSSYATAVTGVSSFWGDGVSYDYTPWEILGKQDVTKYGDSPRTWCPLTLTGDDKLDNGSMNGLNFSWNPNTAYTQYGYTEYIELSFAYEVYAFSVEVGMCRGMGSLVNVKAQSPEGWKSLWSQPASKQILQTSAATKSYYTYQISLCETTYKTSSLRLEYDTRDVGDWAETDYVYFVGTTDLRPAVFEWNHTRVVYIPDKNYFGDDSFEFLANDCPFSGLRDSDPGTINITVNKIDVPPICAPIQSTVTLGKEILIYLQNSSQEVNGGNITKYSILSLPKYGKLYSVEDDFEITEVPTNVTGGTLRLSTDYWQWEGTLKVSFVYKVYAVLASTENATVSIELHVPATENPAIAWIMLLVLLFLTIPAYPLLMTRHNVYPLRTTSYALNMVATTGALLFANIPLQLIAFSDYPCWFYYFSYMLAPAIFATPILVGIYRHHYVYQLNKIKRRIAKADKESSYSTRVGEPQQHHHRGPASADLESVAYLRKLTSESRLLLLTGAGCLVPFILAFGLMPAATGTFGYTYCHMGPVVEISYLVYWIIYTGAIAGGLYYVRNDHELVGFRRHIFSTELTSIFVGLLYLIVYGVIPANTRYASFGLLFVVIPAAYQFLAISRPAIQTFPILRKPTKSREEEGGEPLSEVIITSKGFSWYLEFTMAEFSQESPLAWKAIQGFKSKTSYDAMRDIFTKYFAEGAPLLVNLAASSLRELRALVDRTTQQTPMEQLQTIYDVVQMELMELMQQDSYMRFISSDYYQRYKRNETVPKQDGYTVTSNPKDEYETISPFSKPGLTFGGIKKSSPDASQHERDPLAVSGAGESKMEVSGVGERDSESRREPEKLTIAINGLSRPDSPAGEMTPSASTSLAEPSSLFGSVEMTARQSDAHDRHETVLEEPDVEEDSDQGQVL